MMTLRLIEQLFLLPLKRRQQYSLRKDGRFHSDYTRYREEIRQDCKGFCVYCDGHEYDFGGADMMELEHFRPQSLFKDQKSSPHNLVWSCRKCNNLKGNHWPEEVPGVSPDSVPGFIDPFSMDRKLYFQINSDGWLEPLNTRAEYIEKLLLINRKPCRDMRKDRLARYERLFDFREIIAENERMVRKAEEWGDANLLECARREQQRLEIHHKKILDGIELHQFPVSVSELEQCLCCE